MMMKVCQTVSLSVFLFVFAAVSAFAQGIPALSPDQPAEAVKPVETAAADPLKAELQGAADLFNETDFNGALEKLKEICGRNTKLAPPRLMLAQWFSRANQPNGVFASLNAATTESPTDPEAFILLGEIALKKNETAAATLFFQKGGALLAQYSADAERKKLMQISLLRNETILAELRSDWKGMENCSDQRVALEGKTPELLRVKAVSLFRQERDQECAQWLAQADQAAASQKNKGLPAEAILAQLYTSRGGDENIDRGKKFLNAAVQKYPKSKEVLALSVNTKLADDDLTGARRLAESLVAEDPNAKQLLATVALFQGEYATAEKLFQDIVVESPANIAATNGLALALCEQDDPAKLKRAGEYALENVRKQNNNGDLLGTLGWVLFKAKNYQQAGQVLQQAAAGGNINSQTAYYLAEFVNHNGNKDQAKQLLEAALKGNRPFAKKAAAKKLLETLK
jgi:predicted Zn-dependent protease